MASLIKQPNGGFIVQFYDVDQRRKSLYLGKCATRQAEQVRHRVELIHAAKVTGQGLDTDTQHWLMKIDDSLHSKLANVGLIDQRGNSLLGTFIDNYLEMRKDLHPMTLQNLRYVRNELIEYFGAKRSLQSFTEGDAEEFRQFLIGRGLGENTIRRKCGRARQFFNAAIRRRIITTNPFTGMTCTVNPNESRFHYVTTEDSQKILDACPDSQWRLIFALCRWGGLRCPSEIMPLTWDDVNWENGRLHVTSPKTAHVGKGTRVIPLFPELREHLEAVFDEAEPGTTYVITRYRERNSNLRTQMNRIIKRAGLELWDKPFQNLRSTRETELAERFPMHIVCKWIGNTELVAAKHYLQMTDEHFQQAAGQAMRNPMRQGMESAGIANNG